LPDEQIALVLLVKLKSHLGETEFNKYYEQAVKELSERVTESI